MARESGKLSCHAFANWRAQTEGMQISDEAVSEFMRIYKEEYGEELSRGEADEMASRLVTLYGLLMKKLPNEQTVVPRPPDEPPRSMGFL